MTQTFTASTWGSQGLGPITVRRDVDMESKPQAVARSMARRVKLGVATGPHQDGWREAGGRCVERHYRMTMGRPMRSGGWSVVGEVYFSLAAEE